MTQQQNLVWVAVIAGAFALFWLPVIVAAIRGTDPLGIVVLLTVLTPLCGATWFAAWYAAFALPRRLPAPPPRPAVPLWAAPPPWEDPTCLFGGVPPTDPAVVRLHRVSAGPGVSVWS
jgi:hypothetical protein